MEKFLRTLNYYFNVTLKLLTLFAIGTLSLAMYYITTHTLVKALAAGSILFIVLPLFFAQLRMLAIIEQSKYLE